MVFRNSLVLQRRHSRYMAGLQDPFQDKYINGKSNYKLKSLQINASFTIETMFVNEKIIFLFSILTRKHKTKALKKKVLWQKPVTSLWPPLIHYRGGEGVEDVLHSSEKCLKIKVWGCITYNRRRIFIF